MGEFEPCEWNLVAMNEIKPYGWNDELDVLDDMERYGHINEIYDIVETDWKGETRSFGWSF